jgi:4'-phosphopantetheinyl transferase
MPELWQPALWQPAPAALTLKPADVHLWLVDLDRPATVEAVLSADEQARAARFHFERDRQHYITGRGSLRLILGRYLGVEPGQLRFDYTAYGRPLLANPFAASGLRFNVSHAQAIYLLGATRNREIGVDVEAIRPLPDALDIAGRFFAPGEQTALRRVPAAQKETAFFHCWTRKEAYIKALGSGLSQPLDEFEVSFLPGDPPRLLSVRGKPAEANRWQLHAFTPRPGYVAALIAEGQDWQPTTFRLEEA